METLSQYMCRKGFPNINRAINSSGDDGKRINKEVLGRVLEFMKNEGWVRVEFSSPEDILDSINEGDQIRYTTTDNTFCIGGWITSKHTEEEDEKIHHPDGKGYIMYRTHVQTWRSIAIIRIREFYRLDKDIQLFNKKQRPVKLKAPDQSRKTKFSVKLKDKDGESVVVFYGKDNYALERFMNSAKFQRAVNAGWVFDCTK